MSSIPSGTSAEDWREMFDQFITATGIGAFITPIIAIGGLAIAGYIAYRIARNKYGE